MLPMFVKLGLLTICLFVVVMVMILGSRFVRRRNRNKAKLAQNYFKRSNSHKPLLSYNENKSHAKNFSEVQNTFKIVFLFEKFNYNTTNVQFSQVNIPVVKKSAVKVSGNVLGFGSFGSVHLVEVKEDNIKKLYKEKVSFIKLYQSF